MRALSHAGRVKLGRWPQKMESLVMKYDRVQESKKRPPSTRSKSRMVMRVRDSNSERWISASSSSESEVVGVKISLILDDDVGRNRSSESVIVRVTLYD